MAVYRIVNIFHSTTGLPADDVHNTLHFMTAEGSHSPTTAQALNGHVAASFTASDVGSGIFSVAEYISAEISRTVLPTVKAYNPAGGSPLAVDTWAGMAAPAQDDTLPAEVACCLSFHADLTNILEEDVDDADADDRPERPASRRRGRLFIGPLTTDTATLGVPCKPSTPFITTLLFFADKLRSTSLLAGGAGNADWVIRSDSGFAGNSYEVVDAWVDDAFDTQRRRGRKATTRTFANL